MKEIRLTISHEMWKQYIEAIHDDKLTEEVQFEQCAQFHLYQTMERVIKNHKHPETGFTKQQMVHFRRGESAGRAWCFGSLGATRDDFEQAGKMWLRHVGSAEHVQELLWKGWLSVWKG